MNTHTQGEHAQPDALRLADAIDPFTRQGAPDHLTSKVAADHLRALHAQVAALTAAPQGGAYAELPTPAGRITVEDYPGGATYGPTYKDVDVFTHGQMRLYADDTHTLRASHGRAPAGAAIARVVLGVDGKPASEVHLIAEGDELDVEVFDATYPQRAPHRIANLVEQPTAQPAPAATPQADSQPAPANTRQIAECYGDCPADPKTCANPCKFEGRAALAKKEVPHGN